MADVLVVADDLTGANATAADFSSAGLRAATASAATRADVVTSMAARFDVLVATTDSRHSPPDEAAARARSVVRAGWPARLVCNRIDTTLRGNVGATTAAVAEEVRSLTGARVVVLCAPAHPTAGRHTIGGTQLLNGRRLEETEVARDARTPMSTSDVLEILRQQTDLPAHLVPMAVVTGPAENLVGHIGAALDGGAEILIADAMTEDHLTRIATAAVTASEGRDVVWVTSDPGPSSVAMARALGLGRTAHGAPLLVVSGSATELTRKQLQQLVSERGAVVHRVPSLPGGAVPDVEAATTVLAEALAQAAADDIVVFATVVEDSDVRPMTAEDASRIPRHLATAVRQGMEAHPVAGLFTTGGDVTAAVLAELGSHGLEISGEVVPLAVAGTLVGGPWEGLHITTKGGLVGDVGTTVTCLEYLRQSVELDRRRVASADSRRPHPPSPAPTKERQT